MANPAVIGQWITETQARKLAADACAPPSGTQTTPGRAQGPDRSHGERHHRTDDRPAVRAGAFWRRWAEALGRRPLIPAVATLAVIGVLALPFFSMRTGSPDASTDPPSSTTYQAYHLLARGFGPGFKGAPFTWKHSTLGTIIAVPCAAHGAGLDRLQKSRGSGPRR